MLKQWLEGKKTYMVSLGMVLTGISAGFGQLENGGIDLSDCNYELMNWGMVLEGLGLSTLRAGLAKYMPMLRRKVQ
jgi:hypothetical protein